jgi:hypothetical protein
MRAMNRALASAFLAACAMVMAGGAAAQNSDITVAVIATGLNGPRGLKFGPDGNLYIAEAGTGGPNTTVGMCTQVPSPIGPYHGGPTARISMIRPDGTRTTVVDHLPSGQTSLSTGDTLGVADIVFMDGELYALIAGGGCSHGNPNFPASVIKVDRKTGTPRLIADLSRFVMTHPSAVIEPDDFEPDETFYSMIAVHGKLYVVGPNHGQIIEVTRNGKIRQVVDLSATQGHIVPTAITFHDGILQVGNLNTFPIMPGSSKIFDISLGGKILDMIPGFTTVVGLAYRYDQFYRHNSLYVLELSTAPGNPTPGTGKVVRLRRSGSIQDVVTGLTLPTAMTFGPDGNLYISNFGAAAPPLFLPGAGEIVQVRFEPFE